HAGQRLGHGGVNERDVVGNFDHVFADDAAGNADEFRIGAVIEQQILAKVWLVLAAIKTLIARSGIGWNHAHAFADARIDGATSGFDDAGEFVAEQRGRPD